MIGTNIRSIERKGRIKRTWERERDTEKFYYYHLSVCPFTCFFVYRQNQVAKKKSQSYTLADVCRHCNAHPAKISDWMNTPLVPFLDSRSEALIWINWCALVCMLGQYALTWRDRLVHRQWYQWVLMPFVWFEFDSGRVFVLSLCLSLSFFAYLSAWFLSRFFVCWYDTSNYYLYFSFLSLSLCLCQVFFCLSIFSSSICWSVQENDDEDVWMNEVIKTIV